MTTHSSDNLLRDISTKIIIYSSEKHKDPVKLLKYLLLARSHRPPGLTLGYVEIQLQKKGVTQALILFCNRVVKKFEGRALDRTNIDILVNGLSIIGNAFAISYDAAKEAHKHDFVISLKFLLETTVFQGEKQLLSRVVKCLANLAMYEKLRSKIMREGVAISIIARLDEIYKRLTDNLKITKPLLIEEIIIESDDEAVITQASRAIRIFCSDQAFQQHLIRFGALQAIGRFLKFYYNQDLFSTVLKSLAVLSCYVKKLSRNILEELTDAESSDRAILLRIIQLLRTRHDEAKLAEPAVVCLTQLASNMTIAKALIAFEVFEATLEAMKHTEDVTRLERLLRLLVVLTKDSAAAIDGFLSHRLRLCCCTQIGETLKILRIPDLKDFHYWILNLYENLYEDKLKDLVSRGLIEVLYDYLIQQLGEFTVESLRTKILASDADVCPVHNEEFECPFYPQYRCTSPTYAEQQELSAKSADALPELMECKLFSESSPAQSPRADWSPSVSPAYSPSRSPTSLSPVYSYADSESPPVSSDDEGVFSSSPTVASSAQDSEENGYCSEGEVEEAEGDAIQEEVEEPPNKRVRLDDEENEHEDKVESSVTASELRVRSNSVLSILGILTRCAHFPVFPAGITKFLPFLLETTWSGRLSVEKEFKEMKAPSDQVRLGRLCFQRAFKILYRLCLDISVFPTLVETQTIPLIYRIMMYGLEPEMKNSKEKKLKLKDFLRDYSAKIMGSLSGMNGSENETSGWREGYFLTMCMTSSNEQSCVNAVLGIPFLYRQFNPTFRKFENLTRNWEVIFRELTNVDQLDLTRFQNCILALNCIAKTKGLSWTDATAASRRKLLYSTSSADSLSPDLDDSEATVIIEVDDGSRLTVPKKYLLDASPVFGAMFEGHFRETGQQAVKIRHTSRAALLALVTQIWEQQKTSQKQQKNDTETLSSSSEPAALPVKYCDYQLSTMFELLMLCDRFLLENLYERTLNTLIAFYFCPYSAAKIYHESLQFEGSHKSDKKFLNLNLLTLKYLLVGDGISFTLRSGTFWKIFDSTEPEVVVKGLKQLLDY